MARTYNGTTDLLTCSVGSVPQTTGGFTVAGIVLMPSSFSLTRTVAEMGGSSGGDWAFYISSSGLIGLQGTGMSATLELITTTANEWGLVAVDKAAGTTAPKYHYYRYSTNAWTHTAHGSTTSDNSAPTSPNFNIGHRRSTNFFNRDIAMVGTWNRRLADAEYELLPFSLAYWYASSPSSLHILDQQATGQAVRDLTGNGANQTTLTGTSVSANSAPIFSYGLEDARVAKQPAAGGGGVSGPRDLLLMGAG